MLKLIKEKQAKRSKTRGGITFSDKDLFEVNAKFKYVVDTRNNKLVILQTEDASGTELDWEDNAKKLSLDIDNSLVRSGTVSRKGKNHLPLIDIRNRIANGVFGESDYLQVSIYEDTVIVEGFEEDETDSLTSKEVLPVIDSSIRKRKKNRTETKKVVSITDFMKTKKKFEVSFSKNEFSKAVGEQLSLDLNFELDTSINTFSQELSNNLKDSLENAHIPLQIASFFSGAGIMDQGFKEAGFDIVFALEKDEQAAETYRYNHGEHITVEDIQHFDYRLMKNAPVVIGGPPCQGFSTANRKTNFLDNPNNMLVKNFIDVIKNNDNCKLFVLENVPQILTAGNGKFKDEIINSLKDFDISYGVLNSASFGCPQERSRAIFIGSKIGKVNLPKPTHEQKQFVTVREALSGLHDGIPNQKDFSKSRTDTLERMKHVGQGENWQAIPNELKTPRMLKGSTHSSIYRRLREDKPSITITNVRKSNILHPIKNRILSVREAARLFGLKDNFVFFGGLSSKQQQIANGVPVELAKAVGNVIKKAISMFNVRNKTETFSLV